MPISALAAQWPATDRPEKVTLHAPNVYRLTSLLRGGPPPFDSLFACSQRPRVLRNCPHRGLARSADSMHLPLTPAEANEVIDRQPPCVHRYRFPASDVRFWEH